MPAHGTPIVVLHVCFLDGKGCLVVANGPDSAVGVVDGSGLPHCETIGAESILNQAVLDDGIAVRVVGFGIVALHSEDRRSSGAPGPDMVEMAMVE